MQAIKEKLSDFKAAHLHHATEGEKAEKEMAKARMEVAREVKMAREAEAEMDLHVSRAVEKAAEHERKHPKPMSMTSANEESYGRNPCNSPTGGSSGYLTDPMNRGGSMDPTAASANVMRASQIDHNHSL